MAHWAVGDLTSYAGTQAKIRFLGAVRFAEGTWAGLQLGEKKGRNNGTVMGTRYFSCPPGHGLFVLAEKLTPPIPSKITRKAAPILSSNQKELTARAPPPPNNTNPAVADADRPVCTGQLVQQERAKPIYAPAVKDPRFPLDLGKRLLDGAQLKTRQAMQMLGRHFLDSDDLSALNITFVDIVDAIMEGLTDNDHEMVDTDSKMGDAACAAFSRIVCNLYEEESFVNAVLDQKYDLACKIVNVLREVTTKFSATTELLIAVRLLMGCSSDFALKLHHVGATSTIANLLSALSSKRAINSFIDLRELIYMCGELAPALPDTSIFDIDKHIVNQTGTHRRQHQPAWPSTSSEERPFDQICALLTAPLVSVAASVTDPVVHFGVIRVLVRLLLPCHHVDLFELLEDSEYANPVMLVSLIKDALAYTPQRAHLAVATVQLIRTMLEKDSSKNSSCNFRDHGIWESVERLVETLGGRDEKHKAINAWLVEHCREVLQEKHVQVIQSEVPNSDEPKLVIGLTTMDVCILGERETIPEMQVVAMVESLTGVKAVAQTIEQLTTIRYGLVWAVRMQLSGKPDLVNFKSGLQADVSFLVLDIFVNGAEMSTSLAHTAAGRDPRLHCKLCGFKTTEEKLRGETDSLLCGGCRHHLERRSPDDECNDTYTCRIYRSCTWEGDEVAIDRSCRKCLWDRAVQMNLVNPLKPPRPPQKTTEKKEPRQLKMKRTLKATEEQQDGDGERKEMEGKKKVRKPKAAQKPKIEKKTKKI
ncbi:unnamed protein product, partial [Mesorhabditis spiculigera]